MKQNSSPMLWIVLVMAIGLIAGIASGLVGIGGGIILVPAMVYFLHYSQHQAQGTSLGVLMFPVVILGFYKYYHELKGSPSPIDFKVVGLLALGFIAGAYLGGSLAIKLNQDVLKKVFGALLLYTGFKMLKWDVALLQFAKGIFSKS
ncbi:MAG TPA: sulfite exporter TauE/SafE family protein [Phnomibacter sp.]|nr:sulfite exporter TauE/SafE family protein [Phnomibacter sp.]